MRNANSGAGQHPHPVRLADTEEEDRAGWVAFLLAVAGCIVGTFAIAAFLTVAGVPWGPGMKVVVWGVGGVAPSAAAMWLAARVCKRHVQQRGTTANMPAMAVSAGFAAIFFGSASVGMAMGNGLQWAGWL